MTSLHAKLVRAWLRAIAKHCRSLKRYGVCAKGYYYCGLRNGSRRCRFAVGPEGDVLTCGLSRKCKYAVPACDDCPEFRPRRSTHPAEPVALPKADSVPLFPAGRDYYQ